MKKIKSPKPIKVVEEKGQCENCNRLNKVLHQVKVADYDGLRTMWVCDKCDDQ